VEERSFVEDHIVKRTIGILNLRLVPLGNRIPEELLVGGGIRVGKVFGGEVIDALSDNLLPGNSEIFRKRGVTPEIVPACILKEDRHRKGIDHGPEEPGTLAGAELGRTLAGHVPADCDIPGCIPVLALHCPGVPDDRPMSCVSALNLRLKIFQGCVTGKDPPDLPGHPSAIIAVRVQLFPDRVLSHDIGFFIPADLFGSIVPDNNGAVRCKNRDPDIGVCNHALLELLQGF
jgi:hypothetical protein